MALKENLETHPEIKSLYHPSNCKNYSSLLKSEGGYGCLISIELKGGIEKVTRFYNNLQICKGPSLGTTFSLACPYVLLAHYKELDWAERCGIPPHLLRVSVGLEKDEILWERFKEALIA